MRALVGLLPLLLTAMACSPSVPPAAEAPAAETAAVAGVEISDPWSAATPGGATVAAGYMTLSAPGGDRLVSVASPRAARVEIHEMRMEGDMMQMRPLTEGLPVPADGVATLAPGGAHLMFMEITAPFVDGETVPVTLTFERAGVVEATLVVRAPGTVAHGAH